MKKNKSFNTKIPKKLKWKIEHSNYIPNMPLEEFLSGYILITDNLFGNGIRIITNYLATAGLRDIIPKSWKIIDVWKDIDDNDIYTDIIKTKILKVSKLLDKGYKVCIRCAAGANRSNNVAIATLVYRDKSREIISAWDYYKKLVKDKVDRSIFMSSLLSITCQEAILELRGN